MAKDYARGFYNSAAWHKTQAAYLSSKNYICEECGGLAGVVHHIRHIRPGNIHDPSVTLDWSNLKALCAECHGIEHQGKSARLYGAAFDAGGNLVKQSDVFLVCGSPGSGKSHYVTQNKRSKDLIIDLDLICAALMGEPESIYLDHFAVLSAALEVRAVLYDIIRARRGEWRRAFVVTSSASMLEIEAISKEINAEIVVIEADLETCVHRILNDQRRAGKENFFIKLAEKWHKTYYEAPKIPPISEK